MSFTKFISFFSLLFLLLPNYQQIISLSSYFPSSTVIQKRIKIKPQYTVSLVLESMAAGTVYNFTALFTCSSSSAYKKPQPNLSLRFNPPSIKPSSRSRFCVAAIVPQKLPYRRRVLRVHGLLGDDSVTSPLPESNNSQPVSYFSSNPT